MKLNFMTKQSYPLGIYLEYLYTACVSQTFDFFAGGKPP